MKKLKLDDFLRYRYPGGLQCSPDGKHYAFSLKGITEDNSTYRYDLYVGDMTGGEPRRLVGDGAQQLVFWDDNSHILAISKEDDGELAAVGVKAEWTLVHRVHIENGERSLLMRLPIAPSRIFSLPDGRYLIKATVNREQTELLLLPQSERQKEALRRREVRGTCKVLNELPLSENGTGLISGNRISLFVYDSNEGTTRLLTDPTWDVNHVAVRDGEVLLTAFPFSDIKTVEEGVYTVDSDTGDVKELIPPTEYSIDFVGYYRGGVLCLALGMKEYGVYEHPAFLMVDEKGVTQLCRYDRRVTNEIVNDTYSAERTEQRISGDKLYFTTTCGIDGRLCAFTPEEGVKEVLGGSISVLDFDVSGDRIVYVAFDGLKLPEIYIWENGQVRCISRINNKCLEERALAEPLRFCFRNRDGIEIDGFVLKPAGFREGKKYPAILHIHGGPKMVFGTVFHHEMQLWAAEGYFVCFCNPRGSCGKGNEFAELRGRLGTIDYNDLMDFTDACIERFPEIDPQRFGVCGGSYGGFMTNWIIGHTDRFACAVSQRSIADHCTDFLIGDIGYYFVPDQHRGTIWDNMDGLWNDSPLKYAPNVKTPTLFIHSDLDFRCPLINGLQMFAALKLHGVETKLCLFRGEDHGLSREGKPQNRIRRMEEILGWMNDHLKE